MEFDHFFKKIGGKKSIYARYSESKKSGEITETNTEFNVNVNRRWIVYVLFIVLCAFTYFSYKSLYSFSFEKTPNTVVNNRIKEKMDSALQKINENPKEKNYSHKITFDISTDELKSWKYYTNFDREILNKEYSFQIMKMILISIIWICILITFYLIAKSNSKEDEIDRWH